MDTVEIVIILFVVLSVASSPSSALELMNFKSKTAPQCFDELPECPKKASRGDCLGFVFHEDGTEEYDLSLALKTLLQCRESCRERLASKKGDNVIPEYPLAIVNQAGGVGNLVTDPFGHFHEICNLEHGFDFPGRLNFMRHMINAETQFGNFLVSKNPEGQLTELGFKKSKLNTDVFEDILVFKKASGSTGWVKEECERSAMPWPCAVPVEGPEECSLKTLKGHRVLNLPELLKTKIFNALKEEGEKLARVKLAGAGVYGIRRYSRAAQLYTHTEQDENKALIAIINAGQKLEEAWPFQIVDFSKRQNEILLKPGDVLWYEGTRLPHGRVSPLEGDFYDEIFVHFRLATPADPFTVHSGHEPDPVQSGDNKLKIKF